MSDRIKCPFCGALFGRRQTQRRLIREHDYDGHACPGSGQNPRSEHDRRPLWKNDLDKARRAERTALAEVERLTETVERVRVLAQNALLANDAGMGYPTLNAEVVLRAIYPEPPEQVDPGSIVSFKQGR